jgi:hypothetical protein
MHPRTNSVRPRLSENMSNIPETPATAVNPETFVAQLRAIRQTIPDYGHAPLATRKTMRSAAAVSVHFVNAPRKRSKSSW